MKREAASKNASHVPSDLKDTQSEAKSSKYQTKGLPEGFRISKAGVEKRISVDDSGEENWQRVFSPLRITADTRDLKNENWGRNLLVRDRDGNSHSWTMPMSMLADDGRACLVRLLSLGLVMEGGRTPRNALIEYISKACPEKKSRCVSQIGWHDGCFVLPRINIARQTTGEHVLLQTDDPLDHAFNTLGTLKDWQREVARFAVGNSRLILALAAAFAAPLLKLTGQPSGGFHLRGHSSTGKTTALVVAGSVWGGGGRHGKYVEQWRVTDNGLEAVCVNHTDALLCLDEIAQVEPKAAAESAYMISNGTGKRRANQRGGGEPVQSWRVVFLSTGEIGLAEKLAEIGKKITAGQEVRVIDVDADAGTGSGLYEELHGFSSGAELSDHLLAAAAQYYGMAAPEFINRIVQQPLAQLASKVMEKIHEFEKRHVPPQADGQVKRVVTRFALLAAAGELAIEFDVLPWRPGQATGGIAKCFQSWLEARGGNAPAETIRGIRQVLDALQVHGDARFEDWGGELSVVGRRLGWRQLNNGKWDYFITTGGWTEITTGFNSKTLARAMVDQGLLLPDAEGKSAKSLAPPHHEKMRLYHIPAASLSYGTDFNCEDDAGNRAKRV